MVSVLQSQRCSPTEQLRRKAYFLARLTRECEAHLLGLALGVLHHEVTLLV